MRTSTGEGDPEEGEGYRPAHIKYMVIVFDSPVCSSSDGQGVVFVKASPVPMKWLGHHVEVTGVIWPGEDSDDYFDVSHVKDAE